MELDFGKHFLGKHKNADIANDQRIGADILQGLKIRAQSLVLIFSGHGIHREIHANAARVGIIYRLGKLLERKIIRRGTHTKGLPRKVHRIRSIEDGGLHFFKIPRRR